MTVEQSSRGHLGRTVKPAPSRGPKPSLSTGQIARAAIRLADLEGLAMVTMQRLAGELGITTMALYRYFPSKTSLIATMIDSVSDSKPEFGNLSLTWDTRLKTWARSCLAIYRDHPWFLEATTARENPMGPNELAWLEAALAMLAESGLKPKERHNVFLAIIAHVRGYATFQRTNKGVNAGDKWTRELAGTLEMHPDRYPALMKAFRSDVFKEDKGAFDFGLTCILDGVRAHVSRRMK